MNAAEFIQFFLTICGGISIVGGAAAVIVKWIAPAFRLNRRVEVLEDHDRRVNDAGQPDLREQCRGIKKNKAETHGVSDSESALR